MFRAKLDGIPPRERDGWFDLLFDLDEIPDDDPELPRGCVPYLPCPVATVSEALQRASVTGNDVFVDVGSGTGRTAFLANLLTGAECIGLEIQPALVQVARERAARLNLGRTRFVEGDAAERLRFITIGSLLLYCPFGGDRVDRVLDDLEAMARTRQSGSAASTCRASSVPGLFSRFDLRGSRRVSEHAAQPQAVHGRAPPNIKG